MINYPFIPYLLIPLGIYATCVLLPLLLTTFASAQKRARVFRFAAWWTLISIVLILLTPSSTAGFFSAFLWSKGATALLTGLTGSLVCIVLLAKRSKPQ